MQAVPILETERCLAWRTETAAIDPRTARTLAQRWCDRSELERIARLTEATDRHDRRVAYVVLRDVLARRAGVRPEAVRTSRDRHGRPVWDGPGDVSLAHTRGHVAIALGVGAATRVGVDVERWDALRLQDAPLLLASFAPTVRARLDGVDERLLPAAVVRAWTAAEACAKLRGTGLDDRPDDSAPGVEVRHIATAELCLAVAVRGVSGAHR